MGQHKRGPLWLLRVVWFSVFSFLWTMVCFVIACIALIPMPRSGRLSHAVARFWGRGLLASFGARVVIEHAERVDPKAVYLMVGNHVSWLDPASIMVAYPGQLRFVLKRELIKVPFIGWYAVLSRHFLLDRSNPREGQRVLERAMRHAEKYGISPVVFPEGTRSLDGHLAPFKTGTFQLALAAGIPVLPFAVLGTFDMMPKGTACPRHGGPITVRFGEPIDISPYKGSAGRKQLTKVAHERVVSLGVPARAIE